MLSGSSGPQKYSFTALRGWTVSISDAWRERGLSHEMYLVARPDGTLTAPVLQRKYQTGYDDLEG